MYDSDISMSFFKSKPNNGSENPDFEKLAVTFISLEKDSVIFLVVIPRSKLDFVEYLTAPVKFPFQILSNVTFNPNNGANP